MEESKAVLVTGASTGIGRKLSERLAAAGHFVYAGARKDADIQALGRTPNIQALRLDVTSSRDIAAAVETIRDAGRGLYGLVNNAGVGTLGPVVNGDEEEFDLVMAVNVRGPYRITKAFAPMILAGKGRIVTIGSISGILAEKNVCAYSMSKHAVEAFADSLAPEVEPFGVRVCLIEPGNFNSEIVRNAARRSAATMTMVDGSRYKDPDEVAEAIFLALFDPVPKRRYLVVSDEEEARRTIEKQIHQLIQLNEDHLYTFNRDVLIGMLDRALTQARPRNQ